MKRAYQDIVGINPYPNWVYNRNMDVTRKNMEAYDKLQERIEKRCLKINPDYYKLELRERSEIRRQARAELE